MTAGAKQYIKDLENRGVDAVPAAFDDVYHFTGSGMHCATFSYWRDDDYSRLDYDFGVTLV